MKRFLITGCVVAVGAMVFAPVVRAQDAPVLGADGKPAAFDTASIRKNVNNVGRCGAEQLTPTLSGIHLTDCPMIAVLAMAYAPKTGEALGFVLGDRLVGVPDWMNSERYDVEARISDADAEAWKDPVRRKEMARAMLQKLLAERCKLVAHREMKGKPIYAIMVGENGPKLKVAETADMDALHEKHPNGKTLPGNGGVFVNGNNDGLQIYAGTIGTLSLALSEHAGRPVVDKTGLTGHYDIDLPRMQSLESVETGADGVPTTFQVMEGLGLKLEAQKEQVEVLVIDHVEKPSEN